MLHILHSVPCEMVWGAMDDPYRISDSIIQYADPTRNVIEPAPAVRPSIANQTIMSQGARKGKVKIAFGNRYEHVSLLSHIHYSTCIRLSGISVQPSHFYIWNNLHAISFWNFTVINVSVTAFNLHLFYHLSNYNLMTKSSMICIMISVTMVI